VQKARGDRVRDISQHFKSSCLARIKDVLHLIKAARHHAYQAVNVAMIELY